MGVFDALKREAGEARCWRAVVNGALQFHMTADESNAVCLLSCAGCTNAVLRTQYDYDSFEVRLEDQTGEAAE